MANATLSDGHRNSMTFSSHHSVFFLDVRIVETKENLFRVYGLVIGYWHTVI